MTARASVPGGKAHVMGVMPEIVGRWVICGHCQKPRQGYASITRGGGQVPLCHPDDGPDCYHLVTVYRHPLPCPRCPGEVGMLTIEQALA